MKHRIVIIMACAFIIGNDFEDVGAQDAYDNGNDRRFVERFEFLLGNTLFA